MVLSYVYRKTNYILIKYHQQKEAIQRILEKKQDVFINVPTGYMVKIAYAVTVYYR